MKLTQEFNAVGARTELAAEIDKGSGYVKDFINTYTYDNLYRVTQIDQAEQSGGNGVADKRIDFSYNAAGQFTEIKRYDDLAGGASDLVVDTDYAYDQMGRLTDLTHSDSSTTFADYDWAYDAGSRVTDFDFTSHVGTDGSVDYDYDDTNQLIDEDYDYQTDQSWTYDENDLCL